MVSVCVCVCCYPHSRPLLLDPTGTAPSPTGGGDPNDDNPLQEHLSLIIGVCIGLGVCVLFGIACFIWLGELCLCCVCDMSYNIFLSQTGGCGYCVLILFVQECQRIVSTGQIVHLATMGLLHHAWCVRHECHIMCCNTCMYYWYIHTHAHTHTHTHTYIL